MSDFINHTPDTTFSGRTMPTHYCNDCGALWAHVTAEDHPGLPSALSDGYMSARSAEWCQVCEAASIGYLAEIPSAVVKGMAPAVERIAELEQELGYSRDECDACEGRLDELERELSDLQEEHMGWVEMVEQDARKIAELERDREQLSAALLQVCDWVEIDTEAARKAQTCLARRDAQVAANALDRVFREVREASLSVAASDSERHIKNEADRYRRQAEGETVFADHGDEIERRFVEDGAVSTDAWGDVFTERQRQVDQEGWTPDHDDRWDKGELARAAACYAVDNRKFNKASPKGWPFDETWWKPTHCRRDLVKAGALILAEIERLDRQAEGGGG